MPLYNPVRHTLALPTAVGIAGSLNTFAAIPMLGVHRMLIERVDVSSFRNAAGEWDILLGWLNAAGTLTNITTIDGSANASANWVAQNAVINHLLDTTATALCVSYNEISGTAVFHGTMTLTYRLTG